MHNNSKKGSQRANPKPATRLQASADAFDSNSEDSQTPEEQKLPETSYVTKEEFKLATDRHNAILEQLLQLQQDNANTQKAAAEKWIKYCQLKRKLY